VSSSSPKQLSPAGTKLAVSIICLLFISVGMGLWIPMFLLPTLDWWKMRTWKPAPCTIIKSPVGVGDGYAMDIVYRYEWDGASFESGNTGSGGMLSMGDTSLWDVPPGTTRTCYVNPRDAHQASLNRDYDPETLIGLAPLLFVLLPLAALIAGWSKLGKPPEAPPPPLPPLREGAVTIQQTPRGGCGVTAILIMILIFGGLAAGLALIVAPRAGYGVYLYAVPFGLIALFLIHTLLYMGLASFNPRVTLTLTPGQVSPGQTLELRWETQGNVARAKSFRIRLEGREMEHVYKSTKTEVFSTTDVFQAGSRDFRRGTVTVTIPETGMHSLVHGSRKIVWAFTVVADCPRWPRGGEDYVFEVLPRKAGAP
jgi:hypothetical protein